MAELGSVGPWQWIFGFAFAKGDVPDGQPVPAGQNPSRFPIKTGLVGYVHLNVLARNDVETGVGEWQIGDIPWRTEICASSPTSRLSQLAV